MADYIEREAALKEFEKVCNVCMALVNKPMCGDCSVADTVRKVKSIPAADVRPVVLCRECEHFSDVMYGGTQFEYGFCDRWADGTRMNPDDFCSRGEKREEN